jgi:hypothetical protein
VTNGRHGNITQVTARGISIAHTGSGSIFVRLGGGSHRRLILGFTFWAVLLAVALLCSADIPPGGIVAATEDVTLVRQDTHQPALIFSPPGGGVGFCIRPDSRWWLPWPVLSLDPHGPSARLSTVFASSYSGFEILGDDSGTLIFAWRGHNGNQFHWYGPGAVQVHGVPLRHIRGRPGFLQYLIRTPIKNIPQFLALVPLDSGGVGLYERREPGPFDWRDHRFGVIARRLGPIDSVTAVRTLDGGIVAVMRAGTRLYETTHGHGNLPADFGTGWSHLAEVRVVGGAAVSASGDADVTLAAPRTQLDLVVPLRLGLALLTKKAANTNGPWSYQRLPIPQHVTSPSILTGKVNGRPNTEIVYRVGLGVFNVWKWDNGTWHQPTPVRWGFPQ